MGNFKVSFTKYDEYGNKIPKSKGELKKFKEKNPNTKIFDSKSEYNRYIELKKLEKEGIIANLTLQVPFLLIPSSRWHNNVTNKHITVRKTEYIADFIYVENGVLVAEDCKGWKQVKDRKTGKIKWKVYTDDVYKLKKKLFLSKYPEYLFKES